MVQLEISDLSDAWAVEPLVLQGLCIAEQSAMTFTDLFCLALHEGCKKQDDSRTQSSSWSMPATAVAVRGRRCMYVHACMSVCADSLPLLALLLVRSAHSARSSAEDQYDCCCRGPPILTAGGECHTHRAPYIAVCSLHHQIQLKPIPSACTMSLSK